MTATRGEVTEIYVATFDRAPDAAGLDYWVNTGLTIEGIAQSFFAQEETQEKYPNTLSNAQFVNEVYNNVYNRDGDFNGATYWIRELDNGTPRDVMIIAMVNGAEGIDQETLDNKVEVGLAFADAGLSDWDDSVDIMSGITNDDATVDSAMVQINDWENDSSAYTFTAVVDRLTGDDIGNIFAGTYATTDADSTYQSFDRVDGGAGNDTLSIALNNSSGTVAVTGATAVSNVETLHLTQNGLGGTYINAAGFDSSIKTILFDGNSTMAGTISAGNVVAGQAMDNAIDDIILSVKSATQMSIVVYEDLAVTGVDISDITLTNDIVQVFISTDVSYTGAIETYNVHTRTGTQILSLGDAATTTVNIDGAGNLALTDGGLAITTVNAYASTGNNTFVSATANTIVIGGSGNDLFTGGAGASSLTGNAGNDTLIGLGGDDYINGGLGADVLTGGLGVDIFDYMSDRDSTTASIDTIIGFVSGAAGDTINVSEAIRSASGIATDTAIAAVNWRAAASGAMGEGASFAGNAGPTYAYQDTTFGGAFTVYIDVNQDAIFNAASDMAINVGVVMTNGDLVV